MLLLDLDGLKRINDGFGHAAGDHAIHTVADALQSAVPSTALSVRFGGDEMVSIIPGACDPGVIVPAIHAYLDDHNRKHREGYDVLASVGVFSTILGADTDFEQLVHEADTAMYADKQRRKKNRLK